MKQLNIFAKEETATRMTPMLAPVSDRQRIEDKFKMLMGEELGLGSMVSYVNNKKLPLLRLYRYKEAFAANFIEQFVSRLGLTPNDYIFDPFCGMGTTLFACFQQGIESVGIDKLPIGVFVARALPLFYSLEPGQISDAFEQLRGRVAHAEPAHVAHDVAIMKVAYAPENLLALRKWKTAVSELDPPLKEIFQLLMLSILESCSYTSKDGQFLRLLKDKRPLAPEDALEIRVAQAEADIRTINALRWKKAYPQPSANVGDARDLDESMFKRPPTAIITSPPYVNRYDYTRSYSLELCFQFVNSFDELKALRFGILRSHIESKVSPHEQASHPTVQEVVNVLSARGKQLNNPRIPLMITGYFVDMEKVINEWARVLAPKAKVVLVVDNVRFDGELLPVDLVLSEMAEAAGFQTDEIIVARYKGNSSQQMGKYGRVPVRESIVVWSKK